jgi:hypothetical protein
MSKIRELLPSNKHSSSRSHSPAPADPYDQIPICLKDRSPPFSQAITLQHYGLTRKVKVR